MKEAIKVLLPIFIGFVITHVTLIVLRNLGPRGISAGIDSLHHGRD